MELKQLEFFVTCVECGSLGKTAEKLYTTQPNVSKVIHALEDELGEELFSRTSKGMSLTQYGRSIYEYALNIMKNSEFIKNAGKKSRKKRFSVSGYQSNLLAQILAIMYTAHPELVIEYRESNVEGMLTNIEQSLSDIAFMYISEKKMQAFVNLIERKKISFTPIGAFRSCIYCGPANPMYNRQTIKPDEVENLSFARGLDDYFAVENTFEGLNVGTIDAESLHYSMYTNSDHLLHNIYQFTDLATMSIAIGPMRKIANVHTIPIEGEDSRLILGYVVRTDHNFEPYEEEFIERIKVAISKPGNIPIDDDAPKKTGRLYDQ